MRVLWIFLAAGMLCSCGGKQAATTYSEGVFRGEDHQNGIIKERRRNASERIEAMFCSCPRPSLAEAYRPVHQSINYYYCKLSMQNGGGRASETASIRQIDLEAFEYGFSPRVIRVQRGDRLVIAATSQDVPHRIVIAGYRVRVPVKKGCTREIRFTAHRAGEFLIQCPSCIRQGHAGMQAKLVVEE